MSDQTFALCSKDGTSLYIQRLPLHGRGLLSRNKGASVTGLALAPANWPSCQIGAVLQLQLNELLLRLLVVDAAAAADYGGCLVGMRHCMFGTRADSASNNA